jgi:hypothetical protein
MIDAPSVTISVSSRSHEIPDVDFKAWLTLNFPPDIGRQLIMDYLRPYATAEHTYVGLRPQGHLTEVVAYSIMDVPIGANLTRVVIGTSSDMPNVVVDRFRRQIDEFQGEFLVGLGRHPQTGIRMEFLEPGWVLEVSRLLGPEVRDHVMEAVGIDNLKAHYATSIRQLEKRRH